MFGGLRKEADTVPPGAAAKAKTRVPFSVSYRDNVEAIVVAIVLALTIRCFFLEVFQIPTTSMEPTLLGESEGGRHPNALEGNCPFSEYHGIQGAVPSNDRTPGDRIMVTKFFYLLEPIRRYDVVVFKYPLNVQRNFIKRVVGLPGEELMLHNGDVYARSAGGEDWRIQKKPFGTQSRIWIRTHEEGELLRSDAEWKGFWDEDSLVGFKERAAYQVRKETEDSPRRSPGYLVVGGGPGKGIQFVSKNGVRDQRSWVQDVRFAIEFEMPRNGGELEAWIEHRWVNGTGRRQWRVRLAPGEAEASLEAPGGANKERFPLSGIPLRSEGFHTLELWYYDGEALVLWDGSVAVRHTVVEKLLEHSRDPEVQTYVGFSIGGATLTLKGVEISRDVHYRERPYSPKNFLEGEAVRIPEDHYLVLGDNVESSHDSRAWRKHTVWLRGGRVIEYEEKGKSNDPPLTPRKRRVQEEFEAYDRARREYEEAQDALKRADPGGPRYEELRERVRLLKEEMEKRDRPRWGVVYEDKFGDAWVIYEDERTHSTDSDGEKFMFIPAGNIIGRALWIWYPWARLGRLIR